MGLGEKKLLDNRLPKCWNRLVQKIEKTNGGLQSDCFGGMEVKAVRSAQDWRRAKAALGQEHGLGAGREAGDRLAQLLMEDGKLVAVLVWCAAAWHLKARDEMVGWDAVTRSQRLKLAVQLRRFLVLEATRRPNLASQCLGAGMRALAGQWEDEHGYRPLLAESFSDPESHAGTVYKATNWVQAGVTQGCSQDHTDFYIPNGRPKKLWLKELAPHACALMCARDLPAVCQGAEGDGGGARSPLKVSQLNSLREAFREVPDPRSRTSRRHPLPAMLGLIALGLLMGARDVLDIWRKVAGLTQSQREALGLRVRDKQSRRLTMPGYDALNDLLGAIDPAAYAGALTAFLQAHAGRLPRSLALDGKSVGNGKCGLIITLCRHEDGRPVAMTVWRAGRKQTAKSAQAARCWPTRKSNWSTRWSPPTRSTTRKPPCASSWTKAATISSAPKPTPPNDWPPRRRP